MEYCNYPNLLRLTDLGEKVNYMINLGDKKNCIQLTKNDIFYAFEKYLSSRYQAIKYPVQPIKIANQNYWFWN